MAKTEQQKKEERHQRYLREKAAKQAAKQKEEAAKKTAKPKKEKKPKEKKGRKYRARPTIEGKKYDFPPKGEYDVQVSRSEKAGKMTTVREYFDKKTRKKIKETKIQTEYF